MSLRTTQPSVMRRRISSGWQTVLTDLSLILFMLTAAAVTEGSDQRFPGAPPLGTPVAVYRADPGAPPLRQWLKDQAVDHRLRLTILAHYVAGGQGQALAGAEALAGDAAAAGVAARIIVEPGDAQPVEASLAYDR